MNVTDVDESLELGGGGEPWAQTDKAGAKVILATNQNSNNLWNFVQDFNPWNNYMMKLTWLSASA